MPRGPGKGVSNNPAGRPKDTPNKVTAEMRVIVRDIVDGRLGDLAEALDTLRETNPDRFATHIISLVKMITPAAVNLDIGDTEGIQIVFARRKEIEGTTAD